MVKYSEAIRLGSMLRPQAFGVGFDGVATCANGAAREAVGKLNCDDYQMRHYFPICETQMEYCPICRDQTMVPNLAGCVAHLNDDHGWTREQIADFVQAIELQQADAAVGMSLTEPVAVHAR